MYINTGEEALAARMSEARQSCLGPGGSGKAGRPCAQLWLPDLDISAFPPHHLGLTEVNASEQLLKSCLGNKKVCDCGGLSAGLYTEKRRKYTWGSLRTDSINTY